MLCAISNAVPEDPVVDTKTGYVYEKTLIEKYLQEKATCPMTGNEMTKDDLLPLKMGKPIKPRHSPQMSIPGILGMLHNEYDAVMLETYELRNSLRGARKELAQSLYMHDAACRTIARLTQEKETAMKALEDLRSQFNEFQADPAPQGAAEGPEGPPSKRRREEELGLTDEAAAEMDSKRAELSEARKARDANMPGLVTTADIEGFTCSLSQPLHSPSTPGILSMAIPLTNPSTEPSMVATGGADHTVKVLDVKEGVVSATLTGHSKKVTALTFAGESVVVSGSADKTVRAWRNDPDDASKWAVGYTYEAPASVVQTCTHPVSRFVVAVCANAFWTMLDVETGRPVWKVQDPDLSEYLCGAMHPDGNFFACGGGSGGLRLFDVRSSPLMSINAESNGGDGVKGAVHSVSFNENGYWAALACDEGVQIWDLRKVTKAQSFNPFEKKTTCVTWDHSGKFLACGGPAIKIYEVINKGKKKSAEAHVIKSLHDVPANGVNSLAFGSLAHSLYVAAADHNLRVYNC